MKIFKIATMVCLLGISSMFYGASVIAGEAKEFDEGQLEQLLAPVALYPDTVLSHILIAATYPLDVVQAARWLKANRDLTGEAAVAAAEQKDWDPSVKALAAFPQIVNRMSEDLDWTQELGEAFLASEEDVLLSIQQLREQAYATGNLKSTEHIKVERELQTIIIEPAVTQVIYIPYYDTRTVYGDWHWHRYPPVYWDRSAYYRNAHRTNSFYWSAGIHVPSSFYFSSFHWSSRHVVVINAHKYSPRAYSSRRIAYHQDAHPWRESAIRHSGVRHRGVTHQSRRVNEQHNRPNVGGNAVRIIKHGQAERERYSNTTTQRSTTKLDRPDTAKGGRLYERHPDALNPSNPKTRSTDQRLIPPRDIAPRAGISQRQKQHETRSRQPRSENRVQQGSPSHRSSSQQHRVINEQRTRSEQRR